MPQLLPTQNKTLELLTHLTSYSDLMVLVSGPQGAGKTTLAQALSSSRDKSDCLYIKASVMLGMSGVLSALAEHWGLDPVEDDTSESREMIRAESQLRFKDETNFLVIIDQADQLDADALNDLAHFALLLQESVSFALFGVSGYEREVKQSPAQAPVYVQILEPLSASEAEELLTWAYGVDGHCPFNENTMERLQESSGNWPGPLLAQAEKAMGVTDSTTMISTPVRQGSSRRMVALLVVASMAVAIAVVYRLHGPELMNQFQAMMEEKTAEEAPVVVSAEKDPVVTTELAVQESPETVESASEAEVQAVDVVADSSGSATAEATPTVTESLAQSDASDALSDKPTDAAVVQQGAVEAGNLTSSSTSVETPADTATPAEAPVTEQVAGEAVVADKKTAAPATDEQNIVQDAGEDNVPEVTAALASTEDQTLLVTSSGSAPAPAAAPATATTPETKVAVDQKSAPAATPAAVSPYSDDEAALLAAEDGYIVQLLGTYSKGSADTFRSEWQDQIPLYLYRSSYKEREWYVVTTGIFSDPFSAQEALEGLPEQLRSQSPWIRPLSQVKAAIR